MKLASIKDCTGCMGCVNACSHGVLDYSFDKHGYFRIDIAHPENAWNVVCAQRRVRW